MRGMTTTTPLLPVIDPAQLLPGTRFDTPFESGCVVWSRPDDDGEFLAHDSDNVLCAYNVVMVTRVQP